MSQEIMKILEMIENGVLTPEAGAKLIEAVEKAEPIKNQLKAKKKQHQMLKVQVLSADGDNVNIQLPIEFARVALQSSKGSLIKNEKLDQYNIDFDNLLEMIDQGYIGSLVDITSADGDIVKIFVE
jgi:hypothetical protein